jgi:EF hand
MKYSLFLGAGAVVALAAAAIAVPSTAPKADADGNGAVSKAEMLAQADARFVKMDANNDGKVSVDDHAALVKKHFAEMDTDKNGSINEAEFVAAHAARAANRVGMDLGVGPRGEGRMGKRHHGGRGGHNGGMKMMSNADADGDKVVTRTEFRAAAEVRFAKADTNKDGSISATERQEMRGKRRGEMPAS